MSIPSFQNCYTSWFLPWMIKLKFSFIKLQLSVFANSWLHDELWLGTLWIASRQKRSGCQQCTDKADNDLPFFTFVVKKVHVMFAIHWENIIIIFYKNLWRKEVGIKQIWIPFKSKKLCGLYVHAGEIGVVWLRTQENAAASFERVII